LDRFREKHRDRLNAQSSAYKKANRETANASARKWIAANPEKAKQYYANRKAAHPHAGILHEQARRAQKNKAPKGCAKVIAKWVSAWKAKPTVTCYWCKEKKRSAGCHADHIIPLKHGGAHAIENMCVSCSTCNHRKSCRTLDVWNGVISEPVLL
jgi:5-methylcytosine-specific restriction endonuclease McrA